MWWQVKYLVLASISVAVGQIITIDSQIQKHNEESENHTSYLETVNQIAESKLLINENLNTQVNEIEVGHSDESAIESGQSNDNESVHSEESAIDSGQSENNEIEAGHSEQSAIESGQSGDNEIEAGHSEDSANKSGQSEENEIEAGQSDESAIEIGRSDENETENGQSQENNVESGQSEENSQNASETESTETEEIDKESTAEIVSEEVHDSENIIDGDVIETDNGPVRGYFDDTYEIQSFLDIPYGKITGAFEAPTQPDSWEDIRNVTQHKTLCPQLISSGDYTGGLDCLTLSVFAPNDTKNGSVLFHIHDGDFVSGSGDPATYGPNYIVPKGVTLVLPNYRLGPLGFLCLRDDIAQGNAALKDLTLALNWTKHNIASFGGDPSNIVVSGGGSAGALAGYLALSKKSSGYISKVIVDSGSVLSHWALDREPIENADELAKKIRQSLGTNNDNVFEDIDPLILINAAKDMTFKPCIEAENNEEFLTDTPWNILYNAKSNISYILGSANYAGAIQASAHTEESIAQLNENFQNILPNDLKFDNDAQRNYIAERIKVQYFNGEDIEMDKVANLSLCYTDMSYLSPEIRAARPLIKAGATVFFYEFSYVGDLNIDTQIIGATKGDAMLYIFSKDTVEVPIDSDDEKMVNLMTDLWTSFIETGEPTANDVEWNKLETIEDAQEEWLSIGPETKLQKGLHLNRLSLWSEIYDEHFVDSNQAAEYKPSIYSVIVTTIIFLLASTKAC